MKKYNSKKFCFIICTNDEQQLEECLLYIGQLNIPEGYEVEILTVKDASSMTSGYNEAMNASDAKYKIYLHQDTFIIEKDFLKKIIAIFKRDKQIGMIGVTGAEKLSKDGVMWHEERCGNFYRLEEMHKAHLSESLQIIKKGKKEVEVIDGFLMITCVDLPWREDILKGWDFYDVSQCMEFRRAGYKIVVPGQKDNWAIHACGAPSFWNYELNRKIVLEEYPEIWKNQEDRLHILFYHSKSITLVGIPSTLMDMGHCVYFSRTRVILGGANESEIESIMEELEEGHYDLVMSYDFAPGVAVACERMKIKYYAWVYDSPLLTLNLPEAKGNYSYISMFDRIQYERLKEIKLRHLFYLPLAPEVDIFGSVVIKKRDEKKYAADVSFVGRFYDNIHFDEIFDGDHQKLREEAYELIAECDCRWDGKTTIFGKASEELIDYIAYKDETWKNLDIGKRYFCESMKIVRKCNEVERLKILGILSEKYSVTVYTEIVDNRGLEKVRFKPWVDYITEMPKAFYMSKINLNITSRSIESGIPQRVWDIMAVGGFCLTNYQPELEEYFEIGKDLEVYHNLEELDEKIAYYLAHEEQRIRIAINGYKKVREYHNLKKRLQEALDYVNP